MRTVACSETIQAPLAEVFQRALDLPNAPSWSSQITKLELLGDGPVRPGTRFRETRTVFGRDATEEMEVTEVNVPNGYVIECHNHGCHYRSEFRFSELPAGTRVDIAFDVRADGWLAKIMATLMAPLMTGMMVKCLKQDLTDLKKACEAASGTAAAR